LNIEILGPAAQIWTEIFDYEACGVPRTFPVKMVTDQAMGLQLEVGGLGKRNCLYRYVEASGMSSVIVFGSQ